MSELNQMDNYEKTDERTASQRLQNIHTAMNEHLQENGYSTPKWLKKEMQSSEKKLARKENVQHAGDLRNIKKEIKQLNKDISNELLIAKANGFSRDSIEQITKIAEEIRKKSEDAIKMEEVLQEAKPALIDIIKESPIVQTAGKTLTQVGASAKNSMKEKATDGTQAIKNTFNYVSASLRTKVSNGIQALQGIKGVIVDANKKFALGIKNAYTNAVDNIKNKVETNSKKLESTGKVLHDKAEATGEKLVNGAKSLYETTVNGVDKAGKKLTTGTKSFYDNAVNNTKTAVKNVKNFANDVGDKATFVVKEAYGNVVNRINSIHTKFLETNYEIENKQMNHLQKLQEHLESKYAKKAEIRGAFKNLGRALFGKGQQEVDGNAYTAKEQAKLDVLDNRMSSLKGKMDKTAEALKQKQPKQTLEQSSQQPFVDTIDMNNKRDEVKKELNNKNYLDDGQELEYVEGKDGQYEFRLVSKSTKKEINKERTMMKNAIDKNVNQMKENTRRKLENKFHEIASMDEDLENTIEKDVILSLN